MNSISNRREIVNAQNHRGEYAKKKFSKVVAFARIFSGYHSGKMKLIRFLKLYEIQKLQTHHKLFQIAVGFNTTAE